MLTSMIRIGILAIFAFISCQWIKPANPEFRKKPLANEEYSGFISRDFFQVIVKVNANAESIPIREKRNDCKRRSIPLRNRITIPLLVREVKDAENDRLRGINRIKYSYPKQGSAGDTASQGGFDPSGSNQPFTTPLLPPYRKSLNRNNPTNSNLPGQPGNPVDPQLNQDLFGKRVTYGDLLIDKDLHYLQGEFSWFLDSMTLYKEDYTDPTECIFIYRVAKKGLYERIEQTNLSIRWESYE